MLANWGCLVVPNRFTTTPFSIGQGNFPLLLVKLFAKAFASAVSAKVSLDFLTVVVAPAFLLDARIASLIILSISRSIRLASFCLVLI